MLVPKTLDDIVGQPCIRHLKDLVAEPVASCWICEGPPGTGKTTAALALAYELGCHDPFTGLFHTPCAEFGLDAAREMFNSKLRYRYGSESGFNVLILDELEYVSKECSRFLRSKCDPVADLPKNLIVVATSNDSSGLDAALLERFRILSFGSGGHFQEACMDRLAGPWCDLTGQACLPPMSDSWGIRGDRFSMRLAIQEFNRALSSARIPVA